MSVYVGNYHSHDSRLSEEDVSKALRRMRSQARRSFTMGKYQQVIDRWLEFEAFCDRHMWPDWWADMQRLATDARLALQREEDAW